MEKITQEKNVNPCTWYEICCVKAGGIIGSGGKLINHGDTEITKRGKRKLENGKRIHAEGPFRT